MIEYQSGYFAFYCGNPRSTNPYSRGIDYDRWECGWLDAYDTHQEVLRSRAAYV